MGRKRKYGVADLLTFGEFEQLMCVNRGKRLQLIEHYKLGVAELDRSKRIVKADVVRMLNSSVVIQQKTAGKPRGWGRLEMVSYKDLKTKWGISDRKRKQLIRMFNMRVVDLAGSKRIPMIDLEIVLNKQVKKPEAIA